MRGVGRATVLKLASLGADIALTDVHREEPDLPPAEVRTGWRGIDSVAAEVGELGRRCLPVFCDLGHGDQIQDMVNQVVDYYGHIDILVNNARAIIGQDKVPVTELSQEVWDHFLAINTTAFFLCTKLVGRGDGTPRGRWTDCQYRLQRGQASQRHGGRLFCVEIRGPWANPGLRAGPGTIRHYRQRGLSGTHQYRPSELLGA